MTHALLHLAALAVHLADLAELDLGAARCHFNNHPQNPAVLNPALVGFVFGGGGKGGGVARRRRPALGPHLAPPPRTWRARLLTLGVCVVALIFFSHKKKQLDRPYRLCFFLFLFTSQRQWEIFFVKKVRFYEQRQWKSQYLPKHLMGSLMP